MLKLKVGADVESDIRRMKVARDAAGDDGAHRRRRQPTVGCARGDRVDGPARAEFEPYWIEEPTSPDDILGHPAIRKAVRPIRVATGEHVQNRVIFKQMLQAEAIDVVQIDACRVGGVNENLAILLLAAKFGVPVCPHAGGVGLCEMVQHLAMFDFVAVSGTTDESVDRIRRPPARTLHRTGRRQRRPLPRTDAARAPARACSMRRSPSTAFRMARLGPRPARDPTNRRPPSRVGSRSPRPAVDGRRRRWHPSRRSFGIDEFAAEALTPTASRRASSCRRSPSIAETEELLDLAAVTPTRGRRRRLGRSRRRRRRRPARPVAGEAVGALAGRDPQPCAVRARPAWLARPAGAGGPPRSRPPWPVSTTCWCCPINSAAVPRPSREVPEGRFVLDHLAKPADRRRQVGTVGRRLSALRGIDNVVAKMSGLVTEADWSAGRRQHSPVRRPCTVAVFGPDRLMFGSDWPVCTLAASYRRIVDLADRFIGELSTDEQAAVFGAQRYEDLLTRQCRSRHTMNASRRGEP